MQKADRKKIHNYLLTHGMNPEAAKQTLLEFGAILDEADVKFWLHCGTLLGAIREGRFITGDWDIDLIAIAGDWKPKIASKIQKTFELVDLRADNLYPFGYRKIVVMHQRTALTLFFYLYYAPENVFVFPKKCRDPRWRELSSDLLEREIFIQFADGKFRIPDKSEELLETMYGPTWKIPRLKGWDIDRIFQPISKGILTEWIAKHPKESMQGLNPNAS